MVYSETKNTITASNNSYAKSDIMDMKRDSLDSFQETKQSVGVLRRGGCCHNAFIGTSISIISMERVQTPQALIRL